MSENATKVWTIAEMRKWTTSYFSKAGIDTPQLDADILLSDLLGVERIQLLINGDQELDAETLAAFKQRVIRRAKNREPIAYIVGQKEFWSLPLKVTTATLIPRPDTECLVEVVLDEIKRRNDAKQNAKQNAIIDTMPALDENLSSDSLSYCEITRETLPDERLFSYAEIWAKQDEDEVLSDEEVARREAIPELDEDGNPIATRDILADKYENNDEQTDLTRETLPENSENSCSESICDEQTKTCTSQSGVLKIIDIGTGSGAIALALASQLKSSAQILAVDISKDALAVAQENAQANGISSVSFAQSDLLNDVHGQFDVVVSNPPYVTLDEYEKLEPEVKCEPKLALVAGTKGLDIYERLVVQAYQRLNENGILAVEIGYKQGEDVKKIFERAHFQKVSIKTDYAGNPRIVLGFKI